MRPYQLTHRIPNLAHDHILHFKPHIRMWHAATEYHPVLHQLSAHELSAHSPAIPSFGGASELHIIICVAARQCMWSQFIPVWLSLLPCVVLLP
jgi:hypothetical protein